MGSSVARPSAVHYAHCWRLIYRRASLVDLVPTCLVSDVRITKRRLNAQKNSGGMRFAQAEHSWRKKLPRKTTLLLPLPRSVFKTQNQLDEYP